MHSRRKAIPPPRNNEAQENGMSEMNESKSPLTVDECKKNFRHTRDLGLYLDMLNILKSQYLIILCLKNTSGQNISDETAEKIRSIGFSKFTAEPDMKYAGVLNNGTAVCDNSSDAYDTFRVFEGDLPKAKIYISFEKKEAEIKINGKEQSLNDKGINIVVYDMKKSEAADVSCCNASEGKPALYHRNFYYSEQYIRDHIYMPESCIDSVTLPMRKSYFSNRKLNVREVERGIFLPSVPGEVNTVENGEGVKKHVVHGGVCDEGFNFVAGHQLFNTRDIGDDDRHISDSYKVPQENIAYMDETVLYGGSLIEHPGHLIAECFADRSWWIVQNADSDIKIAVEIIWRNGDLVIGYNGSFVREFLDALGISEDRLIVIEKPTQFKKIIVPDQSAIPLYYCFPYEFTTEYIKPFQHIAKRLTPGNYKKIYLTKSKNHNKSTIGEEYFIDFFEKKGFKIITPEDHSIREKIELMYGADEVVTVDGTNSLFTVFCKPSVKLTILTRRLDYWDIAQQLITEAVGIKEFFLVNISGNFLENFSKNPLYGYGKGLTFTYATKEFAKYVKDVYNEELDITPEEALKKYSYDYLSRFLEYYSQPVSFSVVSGMKMMDILRGMSEVFWGKALDTGDLLFAANDDEIRIQSLEQRLQAEQEECAKKIQHLSEKAKGYIDEIVGLKQTLARLEAENKQLCEKNSEMSAYMAEISQLLDALEAGNGE